MLSQQSQEGLRNLAPGAKNAGRSGAQSGWFRVGMVTAALSAPLIARWNSLRKRQQAEAEVEAAPVVARGRLNALTANAQSALGAAQSTLSDQLDSARGVARTLVAQSQPRAQAAIKTTQTLVAQSQPRAQAAIKSVRSATGAATDAARGLAQTTAQAVAKGQGQLADVLDTVRDAADAARETAVKVTGRGRAAAAKMTGARKAAAIQAATAARVAQLEAKRRMRRNTTLWLTGIGVGVAITGVTAYIIMRRRMTNAVENDELVELHVAQVGPISDEDTDGYNQAQMDRDAASAPTGVNNANRSADASNSATMSDLSDMMDDDADEPDTVLIIETEMDDSAPSGTPTDATDAGADATSAPTRADATDFVDIDSPAVANNPAFIGNIHTMIYHPADADTLPAEENQIFFATEEQAIASGYRRSKRSNGSGETDEDMTGK